MKPIKIMDSMRILERSRSLLSKRDQVTGLKWMIGPSFIGKHGIMVNKLRTLELWEIRSPRHSDWVTTRFQSAGILLSNK